MSGELFAFLVLALLAILGGILMLNLTKVIHMLLSLVLTFLAIAGLYVLLSAEFVAIAQVLIYSGAITIIMIFGIMLTRHNDTQKTKGNRTRNMVVGAGVVLFFFTMYFSINQVSFGDQATSLHVENTKQIGIELYSKYIIPFELMSVVLLVSLVGAIILAKRDDEEEAEQK
ncbi:NADH:ubiquinone oxidoreductase subunit J [Thalassobacillus devorans]|uniref:NADH-quinone oxidoreductase subunit J n=1 Tax=Thalassobacillus devorans TaxID=279813 RepID=A0ABQ1NV91_9BACI|nr:NADH-quinone oxidoreductase subunit J [Thalassobacillus devorans]NIK28479.1 NADH-quinone oxidoreductase subunit J [Thalassobacillus devorans]GGC85887.1 NADH:ubiquinone oxidoreductase subunit J [Thalassobacillus devorans]